MTISMHTVLSNGAKMPSLGFGTWNSKPNEVKAAVLHALKVGYRHIDCAMIYKNEKEIGEALAEAFRSGIVSRTDIWVTSKLWNSFHKRDEVLEQLKKTLSDLQLEYLDLYLIHWPVNCTKEEPMMSVIPYSDDEPSLKETWQGMIDVYDMKLVRSIGVSNFSVSKLKELQGMSIFPSVNQCELHPWCRQDDLLKWCKENGVHLTAYSPLGTPGFAGASAPSLLNDPVVKEIADKHGVSSAQILIRWALERGTSVIPKSSNTTRIQSNFEISGINFDAQDLAALNGFKFQHRFVSGVFFTRADSRYKTPDDLWA